MLSRQNLFKVPGGDTVQINKTAEYLRRSGVEVDVGILAEPHDYSHYDLIHFFNIIVPEQIVGLISRLKVPYLVSTIFVDYSEYENNHRRGLLGLFSRHLRAGQTEYAKAIIKTLLSGRLPNSRFIFSGFNESVRRVARGAAMLLPNSESEMRRFRNHFGLSIPYYVVPNGVDPEVFTSPEGIKRDDKLVLCVARVEGLKNQLNLIRAINATGLKLKIIGNPAPNHLAYYQACVREAGENVEFIPYLSQGELARLFAQAKVHVLPSWFETTGLVSLEASLMGCNVVVSNRGDVRDYFGDEAFYCEPGEVESIRHAVVQACQADYSEVLRERIRERFTWAQAAHETLSAYHQVLAQAESQRSARRVALFHQSADLYGSDRVLLDLVTSLEPSRYLPIVMLPCRGPLFERLSEEGVRVYTVPMLTVRRSMFSALGLLRLAFRSLYTLYKTDRLLLDARIDLVHSNTLAVLGGALWAKLRGICHIWHVHEIIPHPRIVNRGYAKLLPLLSKGIACNSQATLKALAQYNDRFAAKARVVWNGLDTDVVEIDEAEVKAFRRELGLGDATCLVALVGRINWWKGQPLLVEAATLLHEAGCTDIEYLIVGAPPDGQEFFRDELKSVIAASPAAQRIHLLDFQKSVDLIWRACDIAVVPSTQPEPFGMVSLEAMRHSRPVVAAAHGGLTEIVVGGETGLHFPPGDAQALSDCLRRLCEDVELRQQMGAAGQQRLQDYFTLRAYSDNMQRCYDLCDGKG